MTTLYSGPVVHYDKINPGCCMDVFVEERRLIDYKLYEVIL